MLPSATIMVVTVTGSTTDGKELSDTDLELTLEACERLLKLDDDKTKLFKFVEKNMEKTRQTYLKFWEQMSLLELWD